MTSTSRGSTSVPLIVLIDIDGALIGDITPQVIEWQFLNHYRKPYLRQYKSVLADVLSSSLLVRRGFTDFINVLKLENKNVEFFIYTASDDKWAKFLIPCIESSVGISFNRPIFTRSNLISGKKSIKGCMNQIIKTLQKKGYMLTSSVKNLDKLFKNSLLIDNNFTLIDDEKDNLIKIPTYEYVLYHDVLRFIPVKCIQENMESIVDLLSVHNMYPKDKKKTTCIEDFYMSYYNKMAENAALTLSSSRKMSKDKVWPTILKELLKNKSLKGTIEKLNKKLA